MCLYAVKRPLPRAMLLPPSAPLALLWAAGAAASPAPHKNHDVMMIAVDDMRNEQGWYGCDCELCCDCCSGCCVAAVVAQPPWELKQADTGRCDRAQICTRRTWMRSPGRVW